MESTSVPPPPSSLSPKAPESRPKRVRNAIWTAAALIIVVYGLGAAESILVPVTVSVFMAIICAPAVRWLERHRIPNVVAVLVVVAAIMLLLAAMGGLIGASVASFKDSIPAYQERLATISAGLISWLGDLGVEVDLGKMFKTIDLGNFAKKAMEYVGKSMGALASVLSDSILVVLTMVLILIEGSTVPSKLRLLSGDRNADISHFKRIGVDVQRYLGIKTILSVGTGIFIGVVAWLLDVDFALLWGLLAFLLNYIPNIGSIIAAVPACLLALIQHGIWHTLGLASAYVIVNMVLGNVVEPMWMGRKLGLSTTVVFLSLVVWGAIWGPVGMLLSVPLTMVLKIMMENSDEWRFVAQLLDTGEQAEAEASEDDPPDGEDEDEDQAEASEA